MVKNLTPNQDDLKIRRSHTHGPNDAFVFLQVKVPVGNAKTAAADWQFAARKEVRHLFILYCKSKTGQEYQKKAVLTALHMFMRMLELMEQ